MLAPRDPPPVDTVSPNSQPPRLGSGLNPAAPVFPSSSNLLTVANQSVLLKTALTSIYDPRRPQDMLRVRHTWWN